MVSFLDDTVFNAALNYVETCTEAEVRAAASSVLVDGITLDSGNFTQGAGSPTGRRTECLVSQASDMKAIAVSTGGSAAKVTLLKSITSSMIPIVHADLPSAVTLGASDEVNLSTFFVQFPDVT